MSQKYGIPLTDLPSHILDAVDAAERTHARTLVVRGPQAVAAIVPMSDFDRIDPPDPGAAGQDPLLALCGSCRHDDFVDAFVSDMNQTTLWAAARSASRSNSEPAPRSHSEPAPPTRPGIGPGVPRPTAKR